MYLRQTNQEVQKTEDELRKRIAINEDQRSLLQKLVEELRNQIYELEGQLVISEARTAHLTKLFARAGRGDRGPMDADVIEQFVRLRSDILQLVRTHLHWHRGGSDLQEEAEFYMRRKLAGCMYNKFFDPNGIRPYGFDDKRRAGSSFYRFEERLRASDCDGKYYTESEFT